MQTSNPLFVAKAQWKPLLFSTVFISLVIIIISYLTLGEFQVLMVEILGAVILLCYLTDWQFNLKHFLVYDDRIVVEYPISLISKRQEISLPEITRIELVITVSRHSNSYINIHFKSGGTEKYRSMSNHQLKKLVDYLEQSIKIERSK